MQYNDTLHRARDFAPLTSSNSQCAFLQRARMVAPVVALILFLLSFATDASKVDYVCPEHTTKIAKTFCVHVLKLRSDSGRKVDQPDAFEYCDELKIGNLKWRLPKIDTREKNDGLYNLVKNRKELADLEEINAWIALRRFGPKIDLRNEKEWKEPRYWLWTSDNASTKEMKSQGIDFWSSNQPRNEEAVATRDWSKSEDCVFACFHRHGHSLADHLEFNDYQCSVEDRTKIVAFKNDLDIHVYVCEASANKVIERKIFDEWWFYGVCCLLVLIPIIILIVVVVLMNRKSRKSPKSKRTSCPVGKLSMIAEPISNDSSGSTMKNVSSEEGAPSVFHFSGVLKTTSAPIFPQSTPKKFPWMKMQTQAIPRKRTSQDSEEEHQYSNIYPSQIKTKNSVAIGASKKSIPSFKKSISRTPKLVKFVK